MRGGHAPRDDCGKDTRTQKHEDKHISTLQGRVNGNITIADVGDGCEMKLQQNGTLPDCGESGGGKIEGENILVGHRVVFHSDFVLPFLAHR